MILFKSEMIYGNWYASTHAHVLQYENKNTTLFSVGINEQIGHKKNALEANGHVTIRLKCVSLKIKLNRIEKKMFAIVLENVYMRCVNEMKIVHTRMLKNLRTFILMITETSCLKFKDTCKLVIADMNIGSLIIELKFIHS